MPHESTVEHTGELFEPTESGAYGPRGFSFADDVESQSKRGNSIGSSSSLSSFRIPLKCDEDEELEDEEEEMANNLTKNAPVKFTVGHTSARDDVN